MNGTTTIGGGASGVFNLTNATGLKTFTGPVTVNAGGTWNHSTANPPTSFGGGITMNGTTFNNGTGAAAFSTTQSLLGSSNMTFGGSVTPAASTTLTNSNSATVSINNIVLTGNFTQGSNTPTLTVTSATPFSGAGTLDASTNTNTVTYTGANPPIKPITYSNLTVNGSGSATVGGATIVNGTMTVNSAVTNNNTLTVTAALSGTNSLIQGASSTLNISGTSGITTLDASSNANTVNYTGAAQTVKAVAYQALGLSGSGAKTMTGVTTITGDFTIGGTASATAAAALTIDGNVTLGSGTTFIAGAFNHNIIGTGNWINNGATIDNSGSTITLNGAAQSIGGSSSTTFNNLILDNSGTKTFNVATSISGELAINGVVVNLGAITSHTAFTLTLDGSSQPSGTWGSTSSAATNQNDTYFTPGTTGILTVAYKAPITYYSRQTGNWNATTTWSTVTYGNATNTGTFPVAGDIVNMGGGNFTVTVNVSSACATLNYQGGVGNDLTITINPGITLDVSGAIDLPSTTFFSGDVNTLAVGAGTLNAGSIDFDGGGLLGAHALTISTGTVTVNADVTPSDNSIPAITFTAAGTLNLAGAFLISGQATFTAATGSTVNYNGAAQSIGDFTYYNLTLSNADTKTLTNVTDINGAVTIGSGTTLDAGALSHTVGGDWINNGTFTHSGSTITFDGIAQNIGGTNSTTFNNISLSGSGTKTFGAASFSAGYFSVATGVIANLGSFATHTANSLLLGGIGQAAGTWGGTGSGATNINITYFAAAAGVLTVSTSGSNIYYTRASGNWDNVATWSTVGFGGVAATSFPTAGSIVNIGGGDFTVTVNVNSACALLNYQGDAAFTTLVSINTGITLDVSEEVNLTNGAWTPLFTFDSNTLAVGDGILNTGGINFTDAGDIGTHALTIGNGTATVTGDVLGGLSPLLTSIDITGAGTLNLGGTFLDPDLAAFTAATNSTVNYNGTDQTIETFTYYNLTTSGSGTKTFVDVTDINGTVTIGAGTTLVSSVSHTVGGNWVNNGTFSNSSGTITLDGTAQSIGGTNTTAFNNLTLAGSGTKTFNIVTTIDATIAINTGVVANLGTAPAVHTARTLSLNSQGQIPGTWGGTGSGAANINTTFFAATTGILNVTNTIYFSRVSGDWDTNATWSTVTYGGTAATSFPIAGDIASIGQNFDVTVDANSACAFITFQAVPPANQENLLTINAGITLDVSGSITIPRAPTGEFNTLAVGDGTLNVGSILFSNGGGATTPARHRITINTGTATVSGAVSEIGSTGSANITFAGAGQLLLGGAFLNSDNGTLTPSTGTVIYNGSAAQTIGDFTYHNLTLNNTSGTTGQLTLADNTTVTNTLNMTSGIVNLNGFTFTLGASGAASTLTRTGSTTTNWMYGGTFSRFWPASTAVTSASGNYYGLFPVGSSSASSYRPVEINSTSSPTGTGSFSVRHTGSTSVTNLSPVFNDGGTNIVRKHNAQFITSTTATGGTYNIGVTMTGLPAIGLLSDIRLAKNNTASTVTTVGTHAAATGSVSNPTANRSGVALVNLVGDFRITTTDLVATPLPIELVSFIGEVIEDKIQLKWKTESEVNNDFFTVERSDGGEVFSSIGQINGKGTTNEVNNYSLIDHNPIYGTAYYRLKQTDFDGTFTYSNIISVTYEGPSSAFINVYPNPSNGDEVMVEIKGLKSGETIPVVIYNHLGRQWKSLLLDVDGNSGTAQKLLNFQGELPAGVYIVKAGPTQLLVKRFIVTQK